jgi:putative FmdB family regulatory protein
LPTYEYRCVSCEHQFERFQRMSDDPVEECEVCGSSVKRLLFPVAIHFKGSGFYSTDYARKNALGSPGNSAGNGGSSEDGPAGDAGGSKDGGGSKEEAGSKDGAKSVESKESSSTVTASAGKND